MRRSKVALLRGPWWVCVCVRVCAALVGVCVCVCVCVLCSVSAAADPPFPIVHDAVRWACRAQLALRCLVTPVGAPLYVLSCGNEIPITT
jgi:hypothetical protein